MKRVISLFLCGLAAASSTPAGELRFGISPTYAMPLVEYRNGVPVQGIIRDMSEAMAQQLHADARYVVLPRKRLEPALLSGEIDMVCYINPKWVSTPVDQFVWLPPLFQGETVVVRRSDASALQTLDDLNGKLVGGVLGYFYPGLDERVLAGKIRRDDAPDTEKSYRKLLMGRVDAVVDNRIDFDYRMRTDSSADRLSPHTLQVNTMEVGCALSRQSALEARVAAQATHAILQRGDPKKWLAKYR